MKSQEGPSLFGRHRTAQHRHNSSQSWLLSLGFPLEVKPAAQSGLPWPCIVEVSDVSASVEGTEKARQKTLASTHGCVDIKEWKNYTILFLREGLSVV